MSPLLVENISYSLKCQSKILLSDVDTGKIMPTSASLSWRDKNLIILHLTITPNTKTRDMAESDEEF